MANHVTNIKKTTTDQLRRMKNQEGLILQGCGGDLQEWLDGINKILTEQKILLDGTRFQQVQTFEHNGLTNLYPRLQERPFWLPRLRKLLLRLWLPHRLRWSPSKKSCVPPRNSPMWMSTSGTKISQNHSMTRLS